MKHNLHHMIILLAIIVMTCNAMEQQPEKQPYVKRIKDLPILGDPWHVTFLTNNEVIIRDERQWLNDITTDTLIELDNIKNYEKISVHPHNKKFMLFNQKKIRIYDTETKKELGKCTAEDKIIFPYFHPSNDNIITTMRGNEHSAFKFTEYDYHHNNGINFTTVFNSMCVHPIEPFFCAFYLNKFHLCSWNEKTFRCLKESEKISINPSLLCYSPDGSTILAHYLDHTFIINADTLTFDKYLTNLLSERPSDIKFHPNSKFFAVLSHLCRTNEAQVRFYKISQLSNYIKDGQPTEQAKPFTTTRKVTNDCNFCHELSFSPDGTKFILALSDKAILYKVPFKVIYHKNTKRNLRYLLFYLNNYILNTEPLPKDIIYLIIRNALEIHKR